MNEKHSISPHEPKEELLSAKDAWQDYLSLKQAMAEKSEGVTLEVDPATKNLVDNLIAAGVGRSPAEIIARAVESFFVATYPHQQERLKILRESIEHYTP
jgi:hypothetical protein